MEELNFHGPIFKEVLKTKILKTNEWEEAEESGCGLLMGRAGGALDRREVEPPKTTQLFRYAAGSLGFGFEIYLEIVDWKF